MNTVERQTRQGDLAGGWAAIRSRLPLIPSRLALLLPLILSAAGCERNLNAGKDVPHGPLAVDERNPVILANDGWNDNWSGEYAVLLANTDGPPLLGIIVSASRYWDDLTGNVNGWKDFVTAARASGLQGVPDVTASQSNSLTPPGDGQIRSTVPNNSSGAKLILELSHQSTPWRPVVVVAGTRLTDIADAYLLDATVVDRVVVVAALGAIAGSRGLMTGPNGDLDPWADWIVAQRFRYIQVSTVYDQGADVTTDDLPNLPNNKFGDWMAAKQPRLSPLTTAGDQMAELTFALPHFIATVVQSRADVSAGFNSPPGQGPPLVPAPDGNDWLVTSINPRLAQARLWQMLLDPRTFGQ
jgi:hypothetical protein